jgi:hypothetical protein
MSRSLLIEPHHASGVLPQGGDSVEEPAAVAEGANAQFLQVLCGYPAQDLAIDVIVAKKVGVLFEAQPAQPRRYIHSVILASEERHPSWTMIAVNDRF